MGYYNPHFSLPINLQELFIRRRHLQQHQETCNGRLRDQTILVAL